jgi:phosphopantothenoylcysteine synthetase/decarboxylase|tara:strand:- start:442 stop:891 length:450 start_codon:yes stop_codon:yes gene_type:complete
MLQIQGIWNAKDVEMTFNNGDMELKSNGTMVHHLKTLFFIAFERLAPNLKTCEIVVVNGQNKPILVTIEQKLVPQVVANVKCPFINIGKDPENWKKLSNTAKKNNWQKEDWLYVFAENETDEDNDDDDEWLPDEDEQESSSDEELSDIE